MLIIRSERKEDYSNIAKINDLAFGQKNEGRLVESLRNNPRFIPELSLVAERDNEVAGHILFFPIDITHEQSVFDSLALAPMSVHPSYQRKGIGSELVRQGLARCREAGFSSVIVLGHHEYYPRFGFRPAGAWNIRAPFDVPDEVFMAVELMDNGLRSVRGTVRYPEEFNEVW